MAERLIRILPYLYDDPVDQARALEDEEEAIYNNRYPLEWHSGKIQHDLHNRIGWKCEHCGAQFQPGDTRHPSLINRDGKPLILTVHHLDGNPANCEYANLLAACQACHLHIQASWKPGNVLPAHWPQPPAWIAERGLAYVPNGQLMLWDAADSGRLGDNLQRMIDAVRGQPWSAL